MDVRITEQNPVAEADYWELLAEDAAAGANDFAEATLTHLERQLPEGYEMDHEGRIIRLDPTLPDYVVLVPLIEPDPHLPHAGPTRRQVRIPVHADRKPS